MDPISNEEIEQILRTGFKEAEIMVEGDGYQYQITVIADTFSGKSTVQRHKQVYALLNQAITNGRLHALSVKTFSPEERS